MAMDARHSGQDVVRCNLCDSPIPPLHCDICQISLCKECVGTHLLDLSKRHQIVQFEERGSSLIYSVCPAHSPKQCELHCESCNEAICVHCFSSSDHQNHRIVDAKSCFEKRKVDIQNDLKELENSISTKYQNIAEEITFQQTKLYIYSENVTTELTKLGEKWHREIDILISKVKSDVDEIQNKHSFVLNKQLLEIRKKNSEIKQNIDDLKILMESNDVGLVSDYNSNISDFRTMPPKLNICFPPFTFPNVNFRKFYDGFTISPILRTTTEEYGFSVKPTEASSTPQKQLLVDPIVINTLKTEYRGFLKEFRHVACYYDDGFWTSGKDNIIRLYSLQGELNESVKTKLGNAPWDIAVTEDGDLLYTDAKGRTVNKVSNEEIFEVIKLSVWKPRGICSTSTDDFLVVLDNDENKESKVVRYCGSTEKQCIQYSSNGQPLYSLGDPIKYINENGNLDICVSDHGAHAVVVTNQAGKLRFVYTGPTSTHTRGSLDPYGITSDSESRILISDRINNRIHIVDEDGNFLRYIDNCDLHTPWGLCVNSMDKLYVAECGKGKVKCIQYCIE